MQHKNAPKDTLAAGCLEASAPGLAQIPMASHIDADVEAIRELQECIQHLWANLSAPSREDLSTRLDLLAAAAYNRATDSRLVRQALQEVLLSIGTGAVAALSEPARRRLAALTGIDLPDHLPPAGRPAAGGQGEVGTGIEQANQPGRAVPPRDHAGQ